jgi:uncharacterized membrane protein
MVPGGLPGSPSTVDKRAPVTSGLQGRIRILSVDALRGLVMIVMALDHVREFFHSGAMSFQPEDLSRTTVPLFLTRWITHICAPVFMFTAGIAAFLWYQRGHTLRELTRFLWTRGLWLVVLDLTVVRFALNFSLTSGLLILNVLWALGWSMVALSLLARLPIRALATLSIAIITLHNLADPINAAEFGSAGWAWNILHQPGIFRADGALVLVAYPLVPWIAVMSAGFCFGRILLLDRPQRQQWLVWTGLGLTVAFLIIRGLNSYGDPAPWSPQASGMTVLSFLRTTKYPPSLDFLLMTLGPAILLLAALDRVKLSFKNPLLVFGRTPLFFFVVHLFVIHALTILFALLRYGDAHFLRSPMPSLGGDSKLYPPGFGYDLWAVYAVWIAVLVILYPVCLWFARMKERRSEWWLRYL